MEMDFWTPHRLNRTLLLTPNGVHWGEAMVLPYSMEVYRRFLVAAPFIGIGRHANTTGTERSENLRHALLGMGCPPDCRRPAV